MRQWSFRFCRIERPARAGGAHEQSLGDDDAGRDSHAGVSTQRILRLEIEVAFDREPQRAAQRLDLRKVLIVRINDEFDISGKLIDRKSLPKAKGKIRVSWSEVSGHSII